LGRIDRMPTRVRCNSTPLIPPDTGLEAYGRNQRHRSRSRRHTIETVICHYGLDMLPKTRGSSHG
jgi:hypothetical protein